MSMRDCNMPTHMTSEFVTDAEVRIMNNTDIREQHGDCPITIRTLLQIAEREGWDLDTRLALVDSETLAEMVVRGVACTPGSFGPGDSRIEFHTVHEDDWEPTTVQACPTGNERPDDFPVDEADRPCANAVLADHAGLRKSVKCMVDLASLTQDEVFAALKVYEDGSSEYDTLQDRVRWMSRVWAECVDRLLRELAYGEVAS